VRYENWSLKLREKHILRVFENRLLRREFGLREMMWWEAAENSTTMSFISCTLHHMFIELSSEGG
jgi:hypothetical protein